MKKKLLLPFLLLGVTFSGCDNSNDCKEYKVNEVEFLDALDLNDCNNFSVSIAYDQKDLGTFIYTYWERYDDFIRKPQLEKGNTDISYYKNNKSIGHKYEKVDNNIVLDPLESHYNNIYSYLKFNKNNKYYYADELDGGLIDDIEDVGNYKCSLKFKFKNKKIYEYELKTYLKETNELVNTSTGIYEYDCVEPLDFSLMVLSESMSWKNYEPLEEWNNYDIKGFDIDDYIIVKEATSEDIKNLQIGDVITCYNSEIKGFFSWRIVDIIYDESNNISNIITQGDYSALMLYPYVKTGSDRYNNLIASGITKEQIDENNYRLTIQSSINTVSVDDIKYIVTSVIYYN